jgi:peroxiredoxin
VPTYYEATWKQPSGEQLPVALYPREQSAVFPEINNAQLMIDLDADGIYKAKDPTIEKVNASKPFRIGGVTYEATSDPAANELVLTPCNKEATELQPLRVGAKAPDFTAEDFEGKKVRLSDFRGKFVYFDVWATWCGPCRGEIPNIQKAHDKYGKDAVVIGVSVDSSKDTAVEFAKKEKMTYTQLWQGGDFQSDVCKLYQINGIPSTYLVDPDGNLAALNLRGEDIEKALAMAAKINEPEGRAFFEEKKEMGHLLAQVENLQSLGREEQAVKMLKEFLSAHPDSPNAESVERWLGFLQDEQ